MALLQRGYVAFLVSPSSGVCFSFIKQQEKPEDFKLHTRVRGKNISTTATINVNYEKYPSFAFGPNPANFATNPLWF